LDRDAGEQIGDLPVASRRRVVSTSMRRALLGQFRHQRWMVVKRRDEPFTHKTWTQFVKSETSDRNPRRARFTKYADSKGVRVFYVSQPHQGGGRCDGGNMQKKLGFPWAGTSTHPERQEQPDWGSARGTTPA